MSDQRRCIKCGKHLAPMAVKRGEWTCSTCKWKKMRAEIDARLAKKQGQA